MSDSIDTDVVDKENIDVPTDLDDLLIKQKLRMNIASN